MKTEIKYYAYKGNEEMALRNGSFLRTSGASPKEFAQYMNGDFMGFIDRVDEDKFTQVDAARAIRLIPKCCGGK